MWHEYVLESSRKLLKAVQKRGVLFLTRPDRMPHGRKPSCRPVFRKVPGSLSPQEVPTHPLHSTHLIASASLTDHSSPRGLVCVQTRRRYKQWRLHANRRPSSSLVYTYRPVGSRAPPHPPRRDAVRWSAAPHEHSMPTKTRAEPMSLPLNIPHWPLGRPLDQPSHPAASFLMARA